MNCPHCLQPIPVKNLDPNRPYMWIGFITNDKKVFVEPYWSDKQKDKVEEQTNLIAHSGEFPADDEEQAIEKAKRLLTSFI